VSARGNQKLISVLQNDANRPREEVMPDFPDVPSLTKQPGPLVAEILSRDSRVPAVLREDRNDYLGDREDYELDRERYYSADFYRLEVERMWSRTWQIACRLEEIPRVGDHIIYEIADKSLIVVRSKPGEIKAFHNACLHRGRTLRESGGHVTNFRCKFHGFAWHLDGKLSFVPCRWDFPRLNDDEFSLPEAKVATWGGFVFVNLDPKAVALEEYLSDIPAHFHEWDYENRYKAAHVGVIVNANWKVAAEAFLETWHVLATHPQIIASTGDANSQYYVRKDRPHYSRLIIPIGVPSPFVAGRVTDQQIVDSMRLQLARSDEELKLPPGLTPRQFAAEVMRARMREVTNGRDFSNVSDSEMIDVIVYFLFPNVLLWGGYANLFYRWRPWGKDPEQSLMEVMLLPPAPINSPPPPPAPFHLMEPGQTFADAGELGALGPFFDQDLGNMAWVQKGMHAARKPGLTLAHYQESQIRHFHRTLEMYLHGEDGYPIK
jgi:phenylpropionate dioxygenase-like ring-hydroxylating dioxygenase large terminal subunit